MNKKSREIRNNFKRNQDLKLRMWSAGLTLKDLCIITGRTYYTLASGLNTGRDFGDDVYATMEARIEQAERELQQAKATA